MEQRSKGQVFLLRLSRTLFHVTMTVNLAMISSIKHNACFHFICPRILWDHNAPFSTHPNIEYFMINVISILPQHFLYDVLQFVFQSRFLLFEACRLMKMCNEMNDSICATKVKRSGIPFTVV